MSITDDPKIKTRDEKGRMLPGHNPPGAGRKRMREDVREMLEAATPLGARCLLDAMKAERPVVVGNGPHATLEMVPDHDVRIKAAEIVFSRLYGKPRQEVTGEDGAPLMGSVATDLLDSMKKLVEDK